MIITKFMIPLWEREVFLILQGDYTDIMKVAEENGMTEMTLEEIKKDKLSSKGASGGAYFCLDAGMGIMWFPARKVSAEILAHEATHIVDWLLKFVGATEEMEARAYTVEWLVKNIPIFLRKMPKK